MEVLKLASDASNYLFENDPLLNKIENYNLKQDIYKKYGDQLKNIGM